MKNAYEDKKWKPNKFIPSPYFPSLKDKRYVRFKLFRHVHPGSLNRIDTVILLKQLTYHKISINHKVYY